MRARDRILSNLEELYRETYERARTAGDPRRLEELDAAFGRAQLMLGARLDIRDLFSVAPAAPAQGSSALEKLESLRRLTKLR